MSNENRMLAQHIQASEREAVMFRRIYPPQNGDTRGIAFGGLPRLPRDFAWLRSTKTGLPLLFLAEVHLAELPAFTDREVLPPSGTLYAFIDDASFYTNGSIIWSPTPPQGNTPALPPADYEAPSFRTSYRKPLPNSGGVHGLCFPRFTADAVIVKTYRPPVVGPDDLFPEIWNKKQQIWAQKQRSAAEAAFGPPPENGLQLSNGRDAIRSYGKELFPDDAWPYAWFTAEAFANEISFLLKDATAKAQAQTWVQKAQSSGRGNGLPELDRLTFRRWCESLTSSLRDWDIQDKIGSSTRFSHCWLISSSPELLPDQVKLAMRPAHAPLLPFKHPLEVGIKSHQMLGHPAGVQQIPDELRQEKVMLFQFDSDPGLYWQWGDRGVVNFWISREDLLARRFDTVEVDCQCA